MPCCALAAFVVGQIVIGFDAFKRFVLGARYAPKEPDVNPAAQWLLFAPGREETRAARGLRPLRWVAAAAALEVVLTAGAAYALRAHRAHPSAGDQRVVQECRRGIPWQLQR